MYIGRFLIVDKNIGAYRVSSRSYPERKITRKNGKLEVVPTEKYDNPYISYTCLRTIENQTVLGNGSHVDTITQKIKLGLPPRDALSLSLLTLDFERDQEDTPRIAGVAGDSSYIGIVTSSSLIVEEIDKPTLISTYGGKPEKINFDVRNASEAAEFIYNMEYEFPVASCAVYDGNIAIYNG